MSFIGLTNPCPVSIAHAELLTFRSEVTQNDFTANIGGDLSLPKGSGPFPVVILLHPCGGLDAVALTTLRAHSRELLSNGFATLILDSYGPRNLMGGKACGGLGHRSVLVTHVTMRADYYRLRRMSRLRYSRRDTPADRCKTGDSNDGARQDIY